MKKVALMMPLVAASLALAGCQSPFLQSLGLGKKTQSGFAAARGGADAMVALEEGRAYLRSGQISAAVASFKIAQLDPAAAADAKNGLGVAYAKLGRLDLADRYFREAIALRPSDDRFAANLLRMQREALLARGRAVEPEPVLAQAGDGGELPALAKPEPVKVATRVRSPEYRITTATALAPAPAIQVGAREVAKSADEPKSDEKPEAERMRLLSRLGVEPLEVAF